MNWDKHSEMWDEIFGLLFFPLIGAIIILPIAGLGAIISRDYKEAAGYFFGAFVSYTVARGIHRYTILKEELGL